MTIQTIDNLRAEIRRLWVEMCNHDGIDEDEKFCCFSDNNPFKDRYDHKMKMYLAIRRNYSLLV